MKAILVIDMPNICYKCPCYDHEGGICQASDSWKTDVLHGCPLKPMPKHDDYRADTRLVQMEIYHTGYADGWNACLDAITGEEDGL